MNKWNKILLGALAVQVLLALWVRSSSETQAVTERTKLLPNLELDSVDRVAVYDQKENPDDSRTESLVVDIVKKDGLWVAASHHDYPVKPDKIGEFLDSVKALDARNPLATSPDKHRHLEVSPENYERKVEVFAGEEKTTLFIGLAAGNRRTALRINDENEVYGVRDFAAGDVAATIRPWIETDYLGLKAGQIQRISVTTPEGTISITETEDEGGKKEWTVLANGKPISVPKNKTFDTQKGRELLSSIRSIRVREPAGEPEGTPLATLLLELKQDEPKEGEDPSTLPPPEQLQLEIAPSSDEEQLYVRELTRGGVIVEKSDVEDYATLKVSSFLKDKDPK